MSDPTGFDAAAPALLLTTGRATVADDPTGFDAGAPAILLTTSRMTTDEVAEAGSPPAGVAMCTAPSPPSAADSGPASAAVPSSAPSAAPSASVGTTVRPTSAPTTRKAAPAPPRVPTVRPPVVRIPSTAAGGVSVRGGTGVTTVTVPTRTLAFTGTSGVLADAATLAVAAALWLRRRRSVREDD